MLGTFNVSHRIGQGGMGTVWQGRHVNTGQPVAIKVLRGDLATDRVYVEGFHREVRSIARLDHPGIVQVFDYGVVSDKAARTYPELQSGALWLAMEFAAGGSLEAHSATESWPAFQRLLVQLLDALAHAHARGLVHRDLKPANVLVRPDLSVQPEITSHDSDNQPDRPQDWVLTDFGLAHMRDPRINEHTGDVDSAFAGTPLFMAPEQFHGEWRNFGPWTDLYSLGAMAYSMAAGKPLFDASSPMAIGIQHISEPVPALHPVIAVPPGFENWLRRLLAKEIGQRYRRAADAAADLLRLGAPTPPTVVAATARTGDGSEEIADEVLELADTIIEKPPTFEALRESMPTQTLLLDEESLRSTLEGDHAIENPVSAPDTHYKPARIAAAPASWEQSTGAHRPRNIPGTGKGIFGVRQPPYVGRRQARDRIWEQLRTVCTEGRTRFVLIRGSAGLGKSRLMNWLATRAHELGVVSSLSVSHSPIMSPSDGLPRSFQSYLGATGLTRQDLMNRLRTTYASFFGVEAPDSEHLAAVVEWMKPRGEDTADDGIPMVQLESPLERYLVAEQMLRRIARDRPVVLGIDDGQWAQDSLGFARHLLLHRDERPLPALVVATLRPDSLHERLVENEFLTFLSEHDASTVIDLEPMDDAVQQRLIESLLGLEDSLVRQVKDVTAGNPFFAIQIIDNWISRDVLQDTPTGYVLAEGETLPTDLDMLLTQRIDEIANGVDDPLRARLAMETAAALGTDVDRQEWEAVCGAIDISIDDDLLTHFMVQGLAVPHMQGWRFRLRNYCDVLETISRTHDRWAAIHTAIASVIDSAGHNGTCLDERRARHLLAADKLREAIPLLWQAVETRMQHSAYLQAQSLLSVIEQVFDDLNYSDDHPERMRLLVPRSEAHRFVGEIDEAQHLLDRLHRKIETFPDELRAEVHRATGNLEAHLGHTHQSLAHYRKARQLFESVGDLRGVARTLDGLGWTYLRMNQFEDAVRSYIQGFETAESADLHLEATWCLCGISNARAHRDTDEGKKQAQEVFERFDALGCRSGKAIAKWILGDYARISGSANVAMQHYEQARHLGQMAGHYTVAQSSIALLGLCELDIGDIDRAELRFVQFKQEIEDTNAAHFARPLAELGLLAVAAHRRDTTSFDKLVSMLHEPMASGSILAPDFEMVLEDIVQVCAANGDNNRADKARELLELVPDHQS